MYLTVSYVAKGWLTMTGYVFLSLDIITAMTLHATFHHCLSTLQSHCLQLWISQQHNDVFCCYKPPYNTTETYVVTEPHCTNHKNSTITSLFVFLLWSRTCTHFLLFPLYNKVRMFGTVSFQHLEEQVSCFNEITQVCSKCKSINQVAHM